MKTKALALVLALAALMLFAPVLGAEEGLTDTEIHIGQWGPQTGPAAPWGAVARGTGVYFDMINAKGGINGRKIVYHMFDDAYNPAKTKAGVKELQESVGIFAWVGGVGTAPGLAVEDYLMERKVPWVGPAAGSMHWITPPQKYLFAVYPLYFIEAKALVRYAVRHMQKKKVAIIYQNDDYGKNGVEGAKEQLKVFGMDLVAEVPVEITDSDLKPHVMQLRRSEADCVLLWVSPKHAVMTVGTAKAMQFAPQFMSTSTCSDYTLMYKISNGLWEGVICTNFGELPDSGSPLMLEYKEAFKKFAAKDERWGTFFLAGFGFAEPLVAGLMSCGKDLTREKLVAQMEKLKNFQGIMGKVTYKPFDVNDPNCRQGQHEVFLTQCGKDGAVIPISGWMEIR
ncbi:MAG: ABC transporter substrate-binding protein [Thermodesulfobacteriota bacterium]